MIFWPTTTGNPAIDNLVARALRLAELADGLGNKVPSEVRATLDRVSNAMENDPEAFSDAGAAELTRHINESLARIS